MSKSDPNKSQNPPSQSKHDPHAAKEAEKYAQPIASREHILDLLEQSGEALTHPQIAHVLEISDPEGFEALRRRLIAMSRDGQLVCNRRQQYQPAARVDFLKGIVIGHRDGFGFVKLEKGGDDLLLSAKQMQSVFDGDRVLVRVDHVDAKGRGHAVIMEVIERNTKDVVGRIFFESGLCFVEVESVRETQQVVVAQEDTLGAKHGQYVVAKILHQPSKREHATGEVTEVLGDHLAPGMEIEVAIRSYNIPHEWPEDLIAQIESFTPEVSEADKSGRIDLRDLPLVTIDGEDARDFDDAVYCERRDEGGWRLYVAIADVSHYVNVDSPLDHEANKRATSVYFPDHVVPMLPELLSNGLCSLNPKVDRLCMVCEMELSPEGKVEKSYFYEAVMHSHARMTYNQVGTILDEPDSVEGIQLCEDFAERLPQIYDLFELYQALRKRRTERGAIDFETVETQIIFGEERKIDAIVPRERNDAHKIIEECMLCANVATAEFLIAEKLPALYRVHEGPGEQKLENLRAFLNEQGLFLGGGETPNPADYQVLFEQIADRPDFSVIQTMMLRSMSQAVYSPEEKGHFGLAYEHYAHFTSPIRRYPDLLVHRAIKSVIFSDRKTDRVRRHPDQNGAQKFPYDFERMLNLGEHCSMAERRADEATRDVTNWLKCEYLQQHLGETFEGLIAAVTGFGFFVELADLYVEGLVHVASLEGDYYQFDQQKQRLTGERSGKRFALADKVLVQVAAINLEERKIDLILVGQGKSAKARRGKRTEDRRDKSSHRGKGGASRRGEAGLYESKSAGAGKRKDRRSGHENSGKRTKKSNSEAHPKSAKPSLSGKKMGGKDKLKSKKKAKPLKVGQDLNAPSLPSNKEVGLHDDAAPRRRAKLRPVAQPRKRKVQPDE
ncbi:MULTISPECIES: ribonuclease R [unclassified Oleiphilus]|uniref:ribonuclease R n=2 Tax=Oleiphilus TaxID=141450 RepID=UPI000838838A|nr:MULTISPECIES: ribonuclease R [unclassified Oleiphilus]